MSAVGPKLLLVAGLYQGGCASRIHSPKTLRLAWDRTWRNLKESFKDVLSSQWGDGWHPWSRYPWMVHHTHSVRPARCGVENPHGQAQTLGSRMINDAEIDQKLRAHGGNGRRGLRSPTKDRSLNALLQVIKSSRAEPSHAYPPPVNNSWPSVGSQNIEQ